MEVAPRPPIPGICLGLQMLFDNSEEGPTSGLGVFPGDVVRFRDERMHDSAGHRLKVRIMGWSPVAQKEDHPLCAASRITQDSTLRTAITRCRMIRG